MKAALWFSAAVVVAFALATLGFLVAMFHFAYSAALTPGSQGGLVDAAFVSFLGAAVSAGLTVVASVMAAAAWDES